MKFEFRFDIHKYVYKHICAAYLWSVYSEHTATERFAPHSKQCGHRRAQQAVTGLIALLCEERLLLMGDTDPMPPGREWIGFINNTDYSFTY